MVVAGENQVARCSQGNGAGDAGGRKFRDVAEDIPVAVLAQSAVKNKEGQEEESQADHGAKMSEFDFFHFPQRESSVIDSLNKGGDRPRR